jgi:hypothetical protein
MNGTIMMKKNIALRLPFLLGVALGSSASARELRIEGTAGFSRGDFTYTVPLPG